MDLINPDGSKMEEAKEADQGAQAEEKKAEAAFQRKYTDDGWLEIKVHILTAASRNSAFNEMRGFLDSTRDEALVKIGMIQQDVEAKRQKLVQVDNRNGFRGFLNGLRRK